MTALIAIRNDGDRTHGTGTCGLPGAHLRNPGCAIPDLSALPEVPGSCVQPLDHWARCQRRQPHGADSDPLSNVSGRLGNLRRCIRPTRSSRERGMVRACSPPRAVSRTAVGFRPTTLFSMWRWRLCGGRRGEEHAERDLHWFCREPGNRGDSLVCPYADQPKDCVPADPLADFRMMYFVAGVSFRQSVVLWSACAERVRQ